MRARVQAILSAISSTALEVQYGWRAKVRAAKDGDEESASGGKLASGV